MVTRWIFTDPETDATWTVPINPDSMTSPFRERQASTINGNFRGDPSRVRTVITKLAPQQWSFSGVIRTKAHYDQLLAWSLIDNPIEITDHLGRTFEVFIDEFAPEDRRPTPQTPWRLRYTVNALLLREVTP